MSDIVKRMKATSGMDIINQGDPFERSVASKQFDEAIKELHSLTARCEMAERDAKRYRWLRDPENDVALVLDKVVGEQPTEEGIGGGGYRLYEYRAGDELDAAIDAALTPEKT